MCRLVLTFYAPQYFDILEQPKDISSVYSDLERYDRFIDPQFLFAIGGTEWNRQNVESMMSDDTFIHYIDDDFTTSFEDPDDIIRGFWAIVVNRTKKTLTVVFRGSVDIQDWIANIQLQMVDCDLPGYTSDENIGESMKYGRVHKGFYKYLFSKTKAGRNGDTKSKGEEIVGMLRGLLEKPIYKDYSIVVTGHSLGGSLSTLFAYRCACLDEFGSTMITNVSFASPLVGNAEFRAKFVELERKRKIRHLRISNYQDVITLTFPASLPTWRGIETYKHVGMNIRLYDGDDLFAPSYRRFYPKDGDLLHGLRNTVHGNILLVLFFGLIWKHSLDEYKNRLSHKDTKKYLESLTLEQLYDDGNVTGWDYLELG